MNSFGNGGGRGNLSGQPETSTVEKASWNVELGRCDDFIMGDLVDVVEDERIEIS